MVARAVSGKLAGGNVTTVIITDDDGQQQEVTTKTDIEAACLQCNKKKYCHPHNTPPLQPPIVNIFGYIGTMETVATVLNGTFQMPDEVDDYTKKFFTALRMPDAIRNNPPSSKIITTEEHIKGWKKAKEKTSSGISGLHFGIFKAHIEDPILAEFDASMRSIAYSTGFVYERWKKGVDVELLKRTLDKRVEKLRTVLLLEADFNMNNKHLSRQAMWLAEKYKVLSAELYGGRKKHRSIEVSWNQRMTGDIL